MMNNMRGQMGPTEEEIMEYLLRQQKVRGPLGDLIDPEGIGSPEVPLDQLPEDITRPPEPNEDITQPQTIDELPGSVPQDVSNISPYGSLQGAKSVGADETHSMGIDPETGEEIIHPGRNHKQYLEMMKAFGFDPEGRF
jgi:hypothetical protein